MWCLMLLSQSVSKSEYLPSSSITILTIINCENMETSEKTKKSFKSFQISKKKKINK